MSKSGQNQAVSNENAALQNQSQLAQELADLSKEYGDQYTSMVIPYLQQLYPELMQTVSGAPTALTEAAQAPVQAATNSAINTAREQQSGLTNPDELYKSIATSGQQQAGLASDQAITEALSSLQNLFSGQQSLASSGLSGTNAAAGQEGNVAGAYGNEAQQLSPWNAIDSIVNAGAEAYGASQGGKASATTQTPGVTPNSVQTTTPQSTSAATPSALQQAYDSIMAAGGGGSPGYAPTASTPISQTQKPQQSTAPSLSVLGGYA